MTQRLTVGWLNIFLFAIRWMVDAIAHRHITQLGRVSMAAGLVSRLNGGMANARYHPASL